MAASGKPSEEAEEPKGFVPPESQPRRAVLIQKKPLAATVSDPDAMRMTKKDGEPADEPVGYVPPGEGRGSRPAGRRVDRTQLDASLSSMVAEEAPRKARVVGWMVSFDFNESGQEFAVREGRNVIGTNRDCDICLFFDKKVSDVHAVLVSRRGKCAIKDEMSTNGVFVNGEDIGPGERSKVVSGDVLKFGISTFKVFLLDPEEVLQLWPTLPA